MVILEALLAVVADTEAVRGHMLQAATAAQDRLEMDAASPAKHMGLLGSDASGSRYHLLAGDVGACFSSRMFLHAEPAWEWTRARQSQVCCGDC